MKRDTGKYLIISLAIILVILAATYYFYNFYVFYRARICISNEVKDSELPCSGDGECLDILKKSFSGEFERLEELPDFLEEKVEEALDSAVFCNRTCMVRRVYGLGLSDVEEVEACKENEKEVVYELRGKESLKFLDYLRETGRI